MLRGDWQPAYKKVTYMGDYVYDITNLPAGYAGYTRDKQTFHIIGDTDTGYTDYDLSGLIAFVGSSPTPQVTTNDNVNDSSGVSYIPGKAGMIAAGIGLIAVLAYFGLR